MSFLQCYLLYKLSVKDKGTIKSKETIKNFNYKYLTLYHRLNYNYQKTYFGR